MEEPNNPSEKPIKKPKKVPKSLSDAEYEDIFTAVLARHNNSDSEVIGDPVDNDDTAIVKNDAAIDESDAATAKCDESDASAAKCDDFDAVLEEAGQEEFDEPDNEAVGVPVDAVDGHDDAIQEEDLEDVDLENMPDDIRAEITRLTNELTPNASDEEELNDSTSVPPKPKQKKTGSGKKEKMKPKTLDFTPGKDIAQTEPVAAKKKGSIGLKKRVDTQATKESKKEEKPKVPKVSKKQKMQERVIEEYGVWVQCTKTSCLKWRYLASVHDPTVLPDKWVCSMNPDTAYNICTKEEQDFNQDEHDEDYVFIKYAEGSVVWAKMVGYPWWPGMIEIDPDEETYFSCDLQDSIATRYHVVFFDERVTRAWLTDKFVMPFVGHETSSLLGSTKTRGTDYKKQVNEAKARAMAAMDMSLKDRLAVYSFCNRYHGKWAKEGQASQPTESINSEEPDLDNILDNAEAFIQNAEHVLEEFFSQPESETASEAYVPPVPKKKKKSKKPKDKMLADKKPCDGQPDEKRKKKRKSKDKTEDKIKAKKQKKTSSCKDLNEKQSKPAKTDTDTSKKVKPMFKAPMVGKVADKPKASETIKDAVTSPKIGTTADTVEEEIATKSDVSQQKIQFDSDVYTMEMATQDSQEDVISEAKETIKDAKAKDSQEEVISEAKETIKDAKAKDSVPDSSSQTECPVEKDIAGKDVHEGKEKNNPENDNKEVKEQNVNTEEEEEDSEIIPPTQMQRDESKQKSSKPTFMAPGLKRAGLGFKHPRTSTPNKHDPPTIDKRGVVKKSPPPKKLKLDVSDSPPPKKQKLVASAKDGGRVSRKQAASERKKQEDVDPESKKQKLADQKTKKQKLVDQESKKQKLADQKRQKQKIVDPESWKQKDIESYLIAPERKKQVVGEEKKKEEVVEEEKKKEEVVEEDRNKQEVVEEDKKKKKVVEEEGKKQKVVAPERKKQKVVAPERKKQKVVDPERKKQKVVAPEKLSVDGSEGEEELDLDVDIKGAIPDLTENTQKNTTTQTPTAEDSDFEFDEE